MSNNLAGVIMMKKFLSKALTAAVIFMMTTSVEAATIPLEKPNLNQTKMLSEVMNLRQSSRDYEPNKPLTAEQLSNILWAANGLTYDKFSGRKGHVNPAALGIYAIDVYAVTQDGIYLYKPESHSLELVASGDYRETTTLGQDFAKTAPLNLVYVEKITAWSKSPHKMPRDAQLNCANIAAGAMTQSVALMAISQDLGSCVRGSIDVKAFKAAAKLKSSQNILVAQTVGDAYGIPKG